VQATLVELSAVSIARAVTGALPSTRELIVCGGGAHNACLLERLGAQLPGVDIVSTEALGIAPDWIEASAFAWLADCYVRGRPGNLPSVTGARRAAVLGALYPGCGND
jgi:anhydro-N-acetylmuramic acid kinase